MRGPPSWLCLCWQWWTFCGAVQINCQQGFVSRGGSGWRLCCVGAEQELIVVAPVFTTSRIPILDWHRSTIRDHREARKIRFHFLSLLTSLVPRGCSAAPGNSWWCGIVQSASAPLAPLIYKQFAHCAHTPHCAHNLGPDVMRLALRPALEVGCIHLMLAWLKIWKQKAKQPKSLSTATHNFWVGCEYIRAFM